MLEKVAPLVHTTKLTYLFPFVTIGHHMSGQLLSQWFKGHLYNNKFSIKNLMTTRLVPYHNTARVKSCATMYPGMIGDPVEPYMRDTAI